MLYFEENLQYIKLFKANTDVVPKEYVICTLNQIAPKQKRNIIKKWKGRILRNAVNLCVIILCDAFMSHVLNKACKWCFQSSLGYDKVELIHNMKNVTGKRISLHYPAVPENSQQIKHLTANNVRCLPSAKTFLCTD